MRKNSLYGHFWFSRKITLGFCGSAVTFVISVIFLILRLTFVAYQQNFADNKSSLPVGVQQKRQLINPLKILTPAKTILPEKKKSTREKIRNCARENFKLPEKNFKKVGENFFFPAQENQKNCQKTFSRALFIFSGKKQKH